mgnify:CR=1 FL=1
MLFRSNYDAAKRPLVELLVEQDQAKVKWHPAEVFGQYLLDSAMLLRNRPLNGQPGFEQIVPFRFSDQIILVDRGWLPTGSKQDSPDVNPLPDDQTQTIVVRLLPSENDSSRRAPVGQLADLNLPKIAKATGLKINTDWYGRLVSAAELPKPLPKPKEDEGNHLSYAIQWLLFGLMALAFLI